MSKKPPSVLDALSKMDFSQPRSMPGGPGPIRPAIPDPSHPAEANPPGGAAPAKTEVSPALRATLAVLPSTPPATAPAVSALPNRMPPKAGKITAYFHETDMALGEGLQDYLRALGYRQVNTSSALKVAVRFTSKHKSAALGKIFEEVAREDQRRTEAKKTRRPAG
ncbi:MAG: hypothetical protein PHE83_17345 [Opitutaceae bacterium]|nr:hypothetical protein [Opitutaceae bacterium]